MHIETVLMTFDLLIFQVEFYDVLDLIQRRKVYVSHGFAYVPHNDLVTLVLSEFRSQLSHALTVIITEGFILLQILALSFVLILTSQGDC